MLIPFVNFVICIILCIDLAKLRQRCGLRPRPPLLGIIFFPILGFGSAQYQGPSAGTSGATVLDRRRLRRLSRVEGTAVGL